VVGRARPVQRTQTGGIIALEGDRQKASEEASQLMAQHCQGQYQVVEEGEHVVGTDTAAASESYEGRHGTYEEGGESTREATEWRIKYVCGAGGPPPAGDETAGAPPPAGGEEPPPAGEGGGEPPPEESGQPPPP
jgi:hypothetical protein